MQTSFSHKVDGTAILEKKISVLNMHICSKLADGKAVFKQTDRCFDPFRYVPRWSIVKMQNVRRKRKTDIETFIGVQSCCRME